MSAEPVNEFPRVTAALADVAWPGGRHRRADGSGPLDGVCEALAVEFELRGASVALVGNRRDSRVTVGSSGPVALLLEQLEYGLGVGPCFDAVATGAPVVVGDVRFPEPDRWPQFAAELGPHPVRSVWAFPLLAGNGTVGVVEGHRDTPGLPAGSVRRRFGRAVALVADGITRGLDGYVPADYVEGASPLGWAQIHQATGMVSADLGIGDDAALARLRALAFSTDRLLGEVSRDVVEHRIFLARD